MFLITSYSLGLNGTIEMLGNWIRGVERAFVNYSHLMTKRMFLENYVIANVDAVSSINLIRTSC